MHIYIYAYKYAIINLARKIIRSKSNLRICMLDKCLFIYLILSLHESRIWLFHEYLYILTEIFEL